MSARDPMRIFQLPGRWVESPTDLSAAYPYGGTELGYMGQAALIVNQTYEPVRCDEHGNEVQGLVRQPSTGTLSVVLRQWDKDLYDRVFPASTVSQDNDGLEFRVRGAYENAALLTTGNDLLFAPDDPQSPAFLAYNPVICIDQTATLNMRLDAEVNLGLVFWLLRPSAGTEPWQMARLQDLELSP